MIRTAVSRSTSAGMKGVETGSEAPATRLRSRSTASCAISSSGGMHGRECRHDVSGTDLVVMAYQ